jgi:hypothetical protein
VAEHDTRSVPIQYCCANRPIVRRCQHAANRSEPKRNADRPALKNARLVVLALVANFVLVQQVGRYGQVMTAVGGDQPTASPPSGLDDMRTHQPGHKLVVTAMIPSTELSMDHVDGLDQLTVRQRSLTGLALPPSIVAAGRYFQRFTQVTNRILMDMVRYELVLLGRFSEKMAMAFFEMSRSWRRTSLSRRSRRNSSSSGFKRPLPGNASAPSANA